MSSLYLTKPGLSVGKNGGHFTVKEEGVVVQSLPIEMTRSIVVMTRVQVSYDAIREILDNQCVLLYLDKYGHVIGSLGSRNEYGRMLVRQLQAYSNVDKRVELAKYIVNRKIQEQRALLVRRNKRLRSENINQAFERLEEFIENVGLKRDINQLMGIEGMATKTYFACYDELLQKSKFIWNGRNRRPPLDPVNAMLSFAYTLLEKEVRMVMLEEQMEPLIGFLHTLDNRKDSLVYDLMDLFRTSVADSFVLRCIGYKTMQPGHFEMREGACLMSDEGRRLFVAAFEKFMEREQRKGADIRLKISREIRLFKNMLLVGEQEGEN